MTRVRPRRRFNLTLRLGFITLGLANIGKLLLERHSSLPEGPRDALSGFLLGIAIATLLLGIWRTKHGDGRSTCAWRTSNPSSSL